jgi:hypothetical protein
MKQFKSKIQNDVVTYVFDQNHTYISIDVNIVDKTGYISTFKKNKQSVNASRELMNALIFIKPHTKTISLKSSPERSQNAIEYMNKYNLKPSEIRQHQQQNLNKYYKKLGFTYVVDDAPNQFEAKINDVINTIKTL